MFFSHISILQKILNHNYFNENLTFRFIALYILDLNAFTGMKNWVLVCKHAGKVKQDFFCVKGVANSLYYVLQLT